MRGITEVRKISEEVDKKLTAVTTEDEMLIDILIVLFKQAAAIGYETTYAI